MPEGGTGHKCPFSVVQAAGTCACRLAVGVVRRGGSEYDCIEASAHETCGALVAHLNARSLPALGYEDDLTLTPKRFYERVMVGGLQGLRMAGDPDDSGLETADIRAVVEVAMQRFGEPGGIPDEVFLPAIEACQLRKRRRRR